MAQPDPIRVDDQVESLSAESLQLRGAALRAAPRALAEHKAAGHAIYYTDPAYPDHTIKEMPDGRRFLTRRGGAPDFEQIIGREIPPR